LHRKTDAEGGKMNEINVVMNTIDRAKHFVEIVSRYDENMDLIRGCYDIDAKSILEIFSMDLSVPVILRVYAAEDRFEVIRNDLKDYIVKS
jgi:phosphotransferase system HPr-like phosphotransfer protein